MFKSTSYIAILCIGIVTGKLNLSSPWYFMNSNDINNDIYNENYYEDLEQCTLSDLPPSPQSMCCGVDVTSNNRIVGGTPTVVNQYPWLALIEYKIKGTQNLLVTKCGGSLISGRHVLTAAHCVTGNILRSSIPRNVILGDYDKYNEGPDCIDGPSGAKMCSDGEVRIAIQKTIHHRHYVSKTNANDIALIELKEMAPYTDAIRPICLPSLDLTLRAHENLWLTIAGWGVMKQVKNGEKMKGTSSAVKRQLSVPYVPFTTCSQSWEHVTKNNICAGGIKGEDACMGDSGGPLMFKQDGQYQLVGTVSFGAGEPCGMEKVPGAYMNVFKYKTWIMDVINKKQKVGLRRYY